MKKICMTMAGALLATAAVGLASTTFQLSNKLRLGVDDNIYQRDKDTKSSFRIVEQPEANLNVVLERTYLSLKYSPAISWYEAREDDETDVVHNLTANLIQELTPVLQLDLSDSLRAGDLPELYDDNGYVVRQDNDNYYNSARASLSYQMRPTTRLDLSGRYMTLVYDDDKEDAHRYDNYDSWVAGLTLRQSLASRTVALADVRYQELTYDHSLPSFNRDAKMIYGGLGLEQTFSREVIGTLRGGVEQREYDDSDLYKDQTKPYVEASLTIMPVTTTRFTFTGSYSISESDIGSYLSQERTYLSASAAHEFTPRIGGYVSASWAHGAYDKKHSLDLQGEDVDEDTIAITARLSYKVLDNHWIELNYQYLKLDSDSSSRENYDDNRVDVAWKWQILNLR